MLKPLTSRRRLVSNASGTVALFLALALVGGCATFSPGPPPVPTPAEVANLEQRVQREPENVRALNELAGAYRLTGQLEAAEATLLRARATDPDNAESAVLLGLTYEDLERFEEARLLYEEHLRTSRSPALAQQVRSRLALVRHLELQAAARDALDREGELANTPPRPRTAAVFPFLFRSDDPELRPLSRALADLLVTDLSQTDRLTVLERLRVQALIDEAGLTEAGLVDPATAVRGGRLLGAENVVVGSISGNEEALQLGAAVVSPAAVVDPQSPQLQESDRLERLFEMEKRLALGVYRSLGIELTPAEEDRVLRQATRNVRALLAYGLGLEAADAGNFELAARHFADAATLDPGFEAAREQQNLSERAATAAGTSTSSVTAMAVGATRGLANLAGAQGMVPALGGRDAVAEALGQEGVGTQGAIIRVLIDPAGGDL